MSSDGYPDGSRTVPVPDLFFGRDLIGISDPIVLKTLLFVMWRVERRDRGAPPCVAELSVAGHGSLQAAVTAGDADVAGTTVAGGASVAGGTTVAGGAAGTADPSVEKRVETDAPDSAANSVTGGVADGVSSMEAIRLAVNQLVDARLLLDAHRASDHGPVRWLFVNNQEGRQAHDEWVAGGLTLPEPAPPPTAGPPKPNVYTLYEQNIGTLTPIIAEELQDAENTYPPDWIEDAIRLAVENNARKWVYVHAILERWGSEGRYDAEDRQGSEEDRERDSEGPYADWVKR